MVLGNIGDPPVCYYCNKPGHVKKDCYKYQNDLSSGRVQGRGGFHRGAGRSGGRNGGRQNGGRQLYNNAVGEGTMNVEEVMKLGLAAVANKEKQLMGNAGKQVSFAD